MKFIPGPSASLSASSTSVVPSVVLALLASTTPISQSHGYINTPASRGYLCHTKLNTDCGAIQWEPQGLEGPSGFPDQGPPDGHIVSAGNSKWGELDEQSAARWSKVDMVNTQGIPMEIKWTFTANHRTWNWRYYITKRGWDRDQPLARVTFETAEPFCVVDGKNEQPPMAMTHSCHVPERHGYHLILAVWEIGDTANSFHNILDLSFPTDPAPPILTTPKPTVTSTTPVPVTSPPSPPVATTPATPTLVTSTPAPPGPVDDKKVIGYFEQWGIYARNYKVKDIDYSGSAAKMTHINYAFGNVRNNRCEVGVTMSNDGHGAGGDAWADYGKAFQAGESVDGTSDTWDQPLRGNWNQLKQLKAKYPHLKMLISLGGWTWSRGFASAARPENREAFVASCVDVYIHGNLPVIDNAGGDGVLAGVFDGIDVDWEYPNACGLSCGTAAEREDFTALLAEFKKQLDAVRPGLLLTIASGAGVDKIDSTDPAQYHKSLDFINVMTYDFHGAWGAQTNHHSALYASKKGPSAGVAAQYNTNDALQHFINQGVPASKLNIGIGFYGRGWTNVPNGGTNGLYQSGKPAPGTYESGIDDYHVLQKLNCPIYTDTEAMATWMYDGNTFWSLDTPENIRVKMEYANKLGLGGAFIWALSGDDHQKGTLITAVSDGLAHHTNPPTPALPTPSSTISAPTTPPAPSDLVLRNGQCTFKGDYWQKYLQDEFVGQDLLCEDLSRFFRLPSHYCRINKLDGPRVDYQLVADESTSQDDVQHLRNELKYTIAFNREAPPSFTSLFLIVSCL